MFFINPFLLKLKILNSLYFYIEISNLILMTRKRETRFARILSLTIVGFSIIILPALIAFSFFLRDRIEHAFETYGRDETFKLINIWGVFGLVRILFKPRRRKREK